MASVKAQIATEMKPVLSGLKSGLLDGLRHENKALRDERQKLLARHREARQALVEVLEGRRWKAAAERQKRFRTGLKGVWDRVRGEIARIRERNEAEAKEAARRDRAELDALIFAQLEEKRRMMDLRHELAKTYAERSRDIRGDLRAYARLAQEEAAAPRKRRRGADR